MRHSSFAAFLLAGLICVSAALAQSADDLRKLVGFSTAINSFIEEGTTASAGIARADGRLADAMLGHFDLEASLAEARAAAEKGEDVLDDLSRAAEEIEYPDLDHPPLARVVEGARPVPPQTVDSYRIDLEVLRRRIEIAETGDWDQSEIEELDRIWSVNALRYIEAENAMLALTIASVRDTMPQHGVSRSYLLSNEAVIPMLLVLAEENSSPEAITRSAEALRSGAAGMRAAIVDSRRALGQFRIRQLFDSMLRRLVASYSESYATEERIASVLEDLASYLESNLSAYDPEDIAQIDQRLQDLIGQRMREQADRIAVIRTALE